MMKQEPPALVLVVYRRLDVFDDWFLWVVRPLKYH